MAKQFVSFAIEYRPLHKDCDGGVIEWGYKVSIALHFSDNASPVHFWDKRAYSTPDKARARIDELFAILGKKHGMIRIPRAIRMYSEVRDGQDVDRWLVHLCTGAPVTVWTSQENNAVFDIDESLSISDLLESGAIYSNGGHYYLLYGPSIPE